MSSETRLLGVPGSGKTTALTQRIEERILGGRYGPDEIAVSSLTRTASALLTSRAPMVNQEHVSTLHALCYRAIRCQESDHWGVAESPEGIKAWNARAEQVYWAFEHAPELEDADMTSYAPPGSTVTGNTLLAEVTTYRQRMIPEALWSPEAREFYAAWKRFKAQSRLLDFTDMIEYCLQAHISLPGIRAGFFDEVQDFTALQLALIRQWEREVFEECFIAGDDDQSLYDFAGADPRELIKDVPGVDVRREFLEQSYRLPSRIADKAQAQLVGLQYREEKTIRPVRKGGAVLTTYVTWTRPDGVLQVIEQCLERGKTLMLLTTCSYMLCHVIRLLRTCAIPFHNEWRRAQGMWNPLHKEKGTSAALILSKFLAGPDAWTDADVRLWAEDMRSDGSKALRAGVKGKMKLTVPGDARSTLAKMQEWFNPTAYYAVMDADLEWYLDQLQDSKKQRYQFPAAVVRKHGVAALTRKPCVTVGTIHSVKGGEADVVILFPTVPPSAAEAWRCTRAGRDAVVRQMYVGMTRAKETLILAESPPTQPRYWYA